MLGALGWGIFILAGFAFGWAIMEVLVRLIG
jgi:hypothetical protein